jgi:protein-S-isoprenylcysteine O-methyltransferase Ste14
MSSPQILNLKPSNRVTIPRRLAIILGLLAWLIGIPIAHGLFPWAIASLTTRFGWMGDHPAVWNLLGLLPVAIATALLILTLLISLQQIHSLPNRVKLELKPIYLVTRGPYRLTRNPMYLAELALWLGWTVFYGSGAVLIGLVTLWGLMIFVAIPSEESLFMLTRTL